MTLLMWNSSSRGSLSFLRGSPAAAQARNASTLQAEAGFREQAVSQAAVAVCDSRESLG